jgi:hypothetical protein
MLKGTPSQDNVGMSTTADPTPPRAKIKLRQNEKIVMSNVSVSMVLKGSFQGKFLWQRLCRGHHYILARGPGLNALAISSDEAVRPFTFLKPLPLRKV